MENERNQCRKCGGEGKPSKGYMNFHNVQTTDLSKEFETKLLDCIKCSSCGHSWIPLKSTRELALEWWKQLCLSCELDDTHYILDSLIRKYVSVPRHYTSLTGREIEEIWRKENQLKDAIFNNTSFDDKPNQKQFNIAKQIVENSTYGADSKNHPINQKQFKEFNPELFKAYIDKFSDEDKVKAIREIIRDLKIAVYVNYIQDDEKSYWEFNSERIITKYH